jgi:hypothetical protein
MGRPLENAKSTINLRFQYWEREEVESALRGFIGELKDKGIHQHKCISVISLDESVHKWFKGMYQVGS